MSDVIMRVFDDIRDGQPNGRGVWVWCPGCEEASIFHVAREDGSLPAFGPCWEWDGNLESPTISPSLLTQGGRQGSGHVCHSFIRDGKWEFLTDSTHALAGQTVPMVPLPDWLLPSGNN